MAQSNYAEALKYAFEALKIREKLQEPNKVGFVLENIGSIYLEMRNFSKAMEYYKEALEIFNVANKPLDIARCKGNIATVLYELGENNKALEYHFSALNIKQEYQDKIGIINTFINIGNAYKSLKQYNDALKYYGLSLSLSQELGSRRDEAISKGNIGEVLYVIGRDNLATSVKHMLVPAQRTQVFNTSLKYLSQAIDICRQINFNNGLIEFTETLPKIYLLTGDNKKSLQVLEQVNRMKDSVLLEQNKNQVATLEVEHALELKDNKLKIAALTAKNENKKKIILSLCIVALISVGGIIFLTLRQRIKQHKEVLHEISYIQSHDVRGPVARIMGLVQLYNEKDVADPTNRQIIEYLNTTS